MGRAEDAWREYLKALEKDHPGFSVELSGEYHRETFCDGYTRGRADAWQLPEVRAEELEEGKVYRCVRKWDGQEAIGMLRGGDMEVLLFSGWAAHYSVIDMTSFRGPLPLGGGE